MIISREKSLLTGKMEGEEILRVLHRSPIACAALDTFRSFPEVLQWFVCSWPVDLRSWDPAGILHDTKNAAAITLVAYEQTRAKCQSFQAK
jgi:hypothetical protein